MKYIDLFDRILAMNYTVKEEAKLLDILSELYPDSSKRTLRNMLKARRVRVGGSVVEKADTILSAGQELAVGRVTREICKGVILLYEDQDILAVNKSEGLLSVPLDDGDEESLLEILREHYKSPQIYPLHRLDRGTSGVMVFAKGKRCTNKLEKMFREHNIQRECVAVVAGNVKEDSGTWESNLVERKDHLVSSTTEPEEGRPSITHYTVVRRSKNFSYLRIRPETGRKHQIRVHTQEVGHPIVGDTRYGSESCNPISRMALHVSMISFKHPVSGNEMCFTAYLPGSFVRLGFPRS
ncbi:MAG: 23S rRNA pseudouridine1911/1915/1917 synthase [Chlamydiales bacterium]